MSAFTNYLENQLIDHVFRTTSYTPPANFNFGLIESVTDGEAGTVTEVSGTGYARVSVTRNGTNFDYTGRQISNLTAITFPTPGGAWTTANFWGIWDQASGGNLLMYGSLDAAKTVGGGDAAPEWPVSGFLFNFTACSSDYIASKYANFLFIGTAFTKPTSINFALYTAAPTAAGGGTEVSAGEYGRISVTPLDANFSVPVTGDGHTENSAIIQFAAPSTSWGSVVAVAASDQSNNLLAFDTFTGVNVNAGDSAPKIAAGGFDYTIG